VQTLRKKSGRIKREHRIGYLGVDLEDYFQGFNSVKNHGSKVFSTSAQIHQNQDGLLAQG